MSRLPLLLAATCVLGACSEEAPPPQPAPPPDRNFTATVNQQPVVGGTQAFLCILNAQNSQRLRQYQLTFSDDLGHSIQVGIETGDAEPGPRAVLSGMATAEGRAYGRPHDARAELLFVEATPTGAVVSGRFSAIFDLANVAPGIVDKAPLDVADALFEQVECVDPKLATTPPPANG